MSYGAKTVDPDEGKVRIRFESLSQRLSRIDVDIVHKKVESFSLRVSQATPDSGAMGCFLLDEIDRLRTLDTAPVFKKLCYELSGLVQSLPELMHHQAKVIDLLIKFMTEAPIHSLSSAFNLISVLGRDLKDDINPHFNKLFSALVAIVPRVALSGGATPNGHTPNPELTAKLFETISYLLNSNAVTLVEHPDELSAHYGALLGNSVDFVRKFAAKSLSIVVKKLSVQVFKQHFRKLFRAVSANMRAALSGDDSMLFFDDYESVFDEEREKEREQHQRHPNKQQQQTNRSSAGVRRTKWLIDGLSQLFFYVCKGIRGLAHSTANKRIHSLYSLLLASTSVDSDVPDVDKDSKKKSKKSNSSAEEARFVAKCHAVVIFRSISRFHKHLFWQQQEETLESDLEFIAQLCTLTDKQEDAGLKNICAEIACRFFLMIFSVSDGRVLKDDAIRERAMPKLLALSQQLGVWMRSDTNCQMSEETKRLAQRCFVTSWLCFPNNSILPSRSAKLLKSALTIDQSAQDLQAQVDHVVLTVLDLTSALVNKLPGNVVGQCILPELNRAVQMLADNMLAEDWLEFALKYLSCLKDNREDTDKLLDLKEITYKKSTKQSGAKASEVNDDSDDSSDDEEIVEEAIPSFKIRDNKKGAKVTTAQQKLAEHRQRQLDIELKKRSFAFVSVHNSLNSQECIIPDKYFINCDSLRSIFRHVRVLIVRDLKAVPGDIFSMPLAFRTSVGVQAMNWFVKGIPQLFFEEEEATSGEKGSQSVLSVCRHSLNQLYIHFEKSSQSLLKEELSNVNRKLRTTLEMSTGMILVLFAEISKHRLSDASDSFGSTLRSEWLRWIRLLCSYFQQLHTAENAQVLSLVQALLEGHHVKSSQSCRHSNVSVIILQATDRLLSAFQINVPGTPQSFLSQLLTQEEIPRVVAALSLPLSSPSYWARLFAARILSYFSAPNVDDVDRARGVVNSKKVPKLFVDHRSGLNSDEDSSGDDEAVIKPHSTKGEQLFDVSEVILDILQLPLLLKNEREILRRLEILEVWSRTEKLAALPHFLSAIASFAVSVFHLKLQSLWTAAVNILCTACSTNEGEAVIWPILSQAIFQSLNASDIHAARDSELAESSSMSGLRQAFDEFCANNNGLQALSDSSSMSILFPIRIGDRTVQQLAVRPDARTDSDTVCLSLLQLLKQTPAVTLKRSKIVVSLFLSFLQNEYYSIFAEEPEIVALMKVGLLQQGSESSESQIRSLSNKACRRRLEGFLAIFAAVPSPKQLFKHSLLYALYQELICKPDSTISALALDCILSYKPAGIFTYRDSLKRLLDDKTIRNELLTMKFEGEATAVTLEMPVNPQEKTITVIAKDHQVELFPFVIRLLFGRLLAKPSSKRGGDREANASKRTAVLSFISRMDNSFAKHFLHLMIRGVLSEDIKSEMKGVTIAKSVDEAQMVKDYLADGFSAISEHINAALAVRGLRNVSWERLQGFLFLLQPVLSILGFRLTSYLSTLEELLAQVFSLAHMRREETLLQLRSLSDHEPNEEEEEEVDGEIDVVEEDKIEEEAVVVESAVDIVKIAKQSLAVRSLVLNRFYEMIEIFHSVHNFKRLTDRLFPLLRSLLVALKSAVIGARKPPALLSLLSQLASHPSTIPLIAQSEYNVLGEVIACISSQAAAPEVGKSILAIITSVLDFDCNFIVPFADEIVRSFCKRFQPQLQSANDMQLLTLGDVVQVRNIGGAKIELQLLCRLAEEIFAESATKNAKIHQKIVISSVSASNLATLVLGLLRAYTNSRKTRVYEDWLIHILQIYKSLLWRIESVVSHVTFFSRLFGPTVHSFSLFNNPAVRKELVAVYRQLASHPSVSSSLSVSVRVLDALTKPDGTIMESRDYSVFVPAMQALSQGAEDTQELSNDLLDWNAVLGPKSLKRSEVTRAASSHVALCAAPVFETIRCLYDNEHAVRHAAVNGMKGLISSALQWQVDEEVQHAKNVSRKKGKSQATSEANCEDWLNILTAIVIPSLRRGIQSSTDSVKKGFLTAFAHLIRTSDRLLKSLQSQSASLKIIASLKSESFHHDMAFLLHEDPEQDFFENIAHIQLHRRARAFMKLKNLLNQQQDSATQLESDETVLAKTLSISTLVHILIPLCFFYLMSDEFGKKLHQNLVQDVAQLVAAISLHLPFNHYMSLFRRTLKCLEREKDKVRDKDATNREKLLQSVLCGVLDCFHFDISTSLAPVTSAKTQDVEEGRDDQEADADEDGDNQIAEEDKQQQEEAPSSTEQSAVVAISPSDDVQDERTIAAVVVRSILPAVKSHLIKIVKDHHGDKSESVQSNIALCLAALIKKLTPPSVSQTLRAHLFSNLVISVVNTLKSKDSDVRDSARQCLSKMIALLGLHTLQTVLFELQSNLREGYMKHVAMYSIKFILSQILAQYQPDVDAPSLNLDDIAALQTLGQHQKTNLPVPSVPEFDQAIPLIMQAVLQDISEEMRQDRETDGAIRVNVMREMKGSKFNDILEMTSKALLFRPTYALLPKEEFSTGVVSSIHAVSSPLLQALQQFHEQNYFGHATAEHLQTLSGRVAEALQRVALGLSHNPSVRDKELLLYLHATLQPFVTSMLEDYRRYKESRGEIGYSQRMSDKTAGRSEKKKKRLKAASEKSTGGHSSNLAMVLGDDEESDFELDLPSYLRGDNGDSDDDDQVFESEKLKNKKKSKRLREGDTEIVKFKAAQWLPNEWRNATTLRKGATASDERQAVIAERDRQSAEQFRVQDGASAPRLTGRNRFDRLQSLSSQNQTATGIDKSTLIAIKYCLTLLYASLKKGTVFQTHSAEIQSMLVPFIPLLRSFLHIPGAAEVVTLATKCLSALIHWGITLQQKTFDVLTNRLLMLMLQQGINRESELCQACLQGLVTCFKRYNDSSNAADSAIAVANRTNELFLTSFPLSELKVRVLVELLTVSLMEIVSHYQQPCFHLIREIIAAKIVLPEMYDLVQKLTEQIVLSHRKGVREMASSLTVQFLLVYPMSKDRFASHLQLCIKNASFEYEEGRASALETLTLLIKSLPVPVIEENAQLIFLPMALHLVNEKVHRCRECVVQVLLALMKKIQQRDMLTNIVDFAVKWLHSYLTFEANISSSASTITPNNARQASHNALSLMKVGAQCVGLAFRARPDVLSGRADYVKEIVSMTFDSILSLFQSYQTSDECNHTLDRQKKVIDGQEVDDNAHQLIKSSGSHAVVQGHWNSFYHLLLLVDTLYSHSGPATDGALIKSVAAQDSKKKSKKSSVVPSKNFFQFLLAEMLLFPHAWVRSVSLRILQNYFKRRQSFVSVNATLVRENELLCEPNGLYHIGRRLAIILNQNVLPEAIEESASYCTLFVLRTMIAHPELDLFGAKDVPEAIAEENTDLEIGEDGVEEEEDGDKDRSASHSTAEEQHHSASDGVKYMSMIQNNRKQNADDENDAIDIDDGEEEDEEEEVDSDAEEDSGDDEEEDDVDADGDVAEEDLDAKPATGQSDKRGLTWMMHRLRAIGADIRGNRRRRVTRVFSALVQSQDISSLTNYLPQIVEVPVRVMLSKLAVEENSEDEKSQSLLREECTELLRIIEMKMGAIEFMAIFSEVQRKVEKVKHDKKRRMKSEAISNPTAYAQKKLQKNLQKKFSRKRKSGKFMAIKGLKRQKR